jgi:hypothetical protein
MKAFIRSTYEYCLAIMPKVKKWINVVDKLQHKCLCSMVGVNIRTSKTALQTLTGIIDMHRRHEELSGRFAAAINTRSDAFMSTIVRSKTKKFLKGRSCFAQCKNHPILQDHETLKEIHKNAREAARENDEIWPIKQGDWKLDDTITFTRWEYLEEIKQQTTHLKYLQISTDTKPRHWYALGKLPAKDARLCLLWTLGKLPGKPRKCLNCGDETAQNYKHFMNCARARGINKTLSSGRWEEMVKKARKMAQRMDGLEHLGESTQFRPWTQMQRMDNGRRIPMQERRNEGRYHVTQ